MPFVDAYPDPFTPPSTGRVFHVGLTILPDDHEVDYKIWLPRVVVDGTEVEVRSGVQISDPDTDLVRKASFTLVNRPDASRFTGTALISVGIGKRVAGAWDAPSMIWLITDGSVDGGSERWAGTPQSISDSITVDVVSSNNSRLTKTSERGLIVYDSDRVTISDTDLRTLYDKDGNAYTQEIKAIPGMTLGSLLHEILVVRCGFTEVDAHELPLSEYPIDRYDCKMGEFLWNPLKAFIGMYSPIVIEDADKIIIKDSTVPQPAGVPAARPITVDDISGLSTSRSISRLDAMMLQFLGLENNYDFTTFRFEYPSETPGGSTRIDFERITIEWRKITSPTSNKVVREALNIETKKTYVGGTQTEEASDEFEFNPDGAIRSRNKTVKSLLPPDNGGGVVVGASAPSLRNSEDEVETYVYAAHPFKPRAMYRSQSNTRTSGLVINDADNPNIYGDPAKQAASVALRSNNIVAGQTYSYETLKTRSESSAPQPDGSVLTRVLIIDEVNPSNPVDYIEKRPGDIAEMGAAPQQQEMPVFSVDNPTRSLERIQNFAVNQLPLKFALPLTKRVLAAIKAGLRTGSAPFIGYDATLKKGVSVAIYDRVGVFFGNFFITGWSIEITREGGLIMTLTVKEMAASSGSLQELDSYTSTMTEGDQVIWTFPIDCVAGFFLSTGPTSVPNVVIEAKHVGGLSWIDLETGDLALAPWDGTTEDFDIRLTAGAVAVPTEVPFDLFVRE